MNKKNKLIPELRFPEFKNEGEWDVKTLGEVAERIEEKVNDKKLLTASISAGIGFVSQAEKFSRDISGAQYKNYIVLGEGEFSYNKGNSKRFPQGCIYKLKEFKQAAVPNAFISFRFKPNFVGDFYQGYFDNNYHGVQLAQFITSGVRMDGLLNIKADDFFSIVLPTPSKYEQQKIASCLASLDDLIAAHTQKLALLKDHKKGLMQNLFPQQGEKVPKLRFKEFEKDGEWTVDKIDNLFHLQDGYAFSSNTFTNSKLNTKQVIRITDINNQNKNDDKVFVLEETTKALGVEKYKVKKGDLLLSLTGAAGFNFFIWESDDAYINQRTMKLNAKKKENDSLKVILEPLVHSKINEIGTGQNNNLSKDAFKEIEFPYPNPKEQQKIASCLSSLDELITEQTEKIEQLKQHKKGLMQGLFPKMSE